MTAQPDLFVIKSPVMKKDARLSDCETYRWTLTRDWAEGERLCWVMLNPSDADHTIDDPTILRCIHFTRSWGYAGFTVVNLYPFRSPNPPKCRSWATDKKLAKAVAAVLTENAGIVAEHCREASMVMAAWGNNPWDAALLAATVESIMAQNSEIYCLGTTLGGAPKHPMARGKHRVPDDQQPVLWKSRP